MAVSTGMLLIFLISLVLTLASAYYLFLGLKKLGTHNKIKGAGAVSPGKFVATSGKIISSPLSSPVAKDRCAWWRVLVWSKGRKGARVELSSLESAEAIKILAEDTEMAVYPGGGEDFGSFNGMHESDPGKELAKHLYEGRWPGGDNAMTRLSRAVDDRIGLRRDKLDDRAVAYVQTLDPGTQKAISSRGSEIHIAEYYVADGDRIFYAGDMELEKGRYVVRRGASGVLIIDDRPKEDVLRSLLYASLTEAVLAAIGVLLFGYLALMGLSPLLH